MQIKFKIEQKLEYINHRPNAQLTYGIDNDGVLRGVDHLGRILFVKQFNSTEELFQFVCGMAHMLEGWEA